MDNKNREINNIFPDKIDLFPKLAKIGHFIANLLHAYHESPSQFVPFDKVENYDHLPRPWD